MSCGLIREWGVLIEEGLCSLQGLALPRWLLSGLCPGMLFWSSFYPQEMPPVLLLQHLGASLVTWDTSLVRTPQLELLLRTWACSRNHIWGF